MNTENISQEELNKKNAEYWNEPCGTHLARNTNTENNFIEFDKRYFDRYPFLLPYLDKFKGDVLEIGIGYGTVATYLSQKCNYLGLDIALGPLDILRQRGLAYMQGNVLDLQFKENTFDGVVCIGCLHHTGDIERGLNEIHRVLKPGGRALIMLYNIDADKLAVDRNTKGVQAPHIEYTDVRDLEDLFWGWASYRYDLQYNKDIYVEAAK